MSPPHLFSQLSSLAANSHSLINDAWSHLEITSMQDHEAVGKMFQRSRRDTMDPMHIVQQ
jgi:hypothetical protein